MGGRSGFKGPMCVALAGASTSSALPGRVYGPGPRRRRDSIPTDGAGPLVPQTGWVKACAAQPLQICRRKGIWYLFQNLVPDMTSPSVSFRERKGVTVPVTGMTLHPLAAVRGRVFFSV